MASSIFQTRLVSPSTSVPLYTLSLRAPNAALSVFGSNTYTFPIAPQQMRKEVVAFNTIMDVANPYTATGVQRMVDQFGQSLPIYTMRGTTGWQYHSLDGYVWTGLGSIARIESILAQYAQLNQQQINKGQGNNLYTLEFYDYFRGEYWQVVPVGPQGIEQGADKPLYSYYTFKFACIQSVSAQIPQVAVDLVANLLGADGLATLSLTTSAVGIYNSAVNSVNSAIGSVQSYASTALSDYF